jgi:hypothetical protein
MSAFPVAAHFTVWGINDMAIKKNIYINHSISVINLTKDPQAICSG